MKSLNFIQIFCFVFALVLYSNTELNAQCLSTDPSTGGVVPTQSSFPNGPPSCGDYASHRFDPVNNETYTDGFGNNITISITNTDCGPVFSWVASDGFVVESINVKGGSNQELNVNTYTYDGQTSDGYLHSPMNPNNDNYYGLSHLDFCYHYKLSASKTAETSFLRTYDWSIDKICQGAPELTLSTNQVYDYPFQWVATTTGYTDSDWAVSGTVTVENNTPYDAEISSIEDILSNNTSVPLSCDVTFPYVLASGATLECSYTTGLDAAEDGTNTVTVTTSSTMVDGDTASADYAFGAPTSEADECVTVSDDCTADVEVCVAQSPFTHSYTCPISYAQCGDYLYVNTATLVTNDNATMSMDNCQVDVNVPCGGCSLTIGYWKTHSENGPAPYDDTWALLSSGADTPFFLSGDSYYNVAWTAPGGNAYYILAHQYIAAELNMLNGADFSDAQAAFDEATVLLNTYTPAQIGALKGKNAIRQNFINLATILDNYNNGLIGPGHCDDDGTSSNSISEKSSIEFVSENIYIYPNPASTMVQVDLSDFIGQNIQLRIYNQLGLVIKDVSIPNVIRSPYTINLDQDTYKNGMYYINIINESSNVSQALLIQNK